MGRIEDLFSRKNAGILNIYITAGYPNLEDAVQIVQELDRAGVDMVEIGMPFSDPLADGPTIQKSSTEAIRNGITIDAIFEQVKEIRKTVEIPLVLMGYYNQVLRYTPVKFFTRSKEAGIDGIIIPDLTVDEYKEHYEQLFSDLELDMTFLVTPQTSVERIKMLDTLSNGFLYLVSSSSTTGKQNQSFAGQSAYFKRLKTMKLKNPTLLGFGISDHDGFMAACSVSSGAIVGSAFIKMLGASKNYKQDIPEFINGILNG